MILGVLLVLAVWTVLVYLGWNFLIVWGIGTIFAIAIPSITLVKAFFLGIIIAILKTVFFSSSK